MSHTRSASDSQTHNCTARPRVRGTLPSFLSVGWVREADSRWPALPAVRHSSIGWSSYRAYLRALRAIHA